MALEDFVVYWNTLVDVVTIVLSLILTIYKIIQLKSKQDKSDDTKKVPETESFFMIGKWETDDYETLTVQDGKIVYETRHNEKIYGMVVRSNNFKDRK